MLAHFRNAYGLITGFAVILIGMVGLVGLFYFHISTMMESDHINTDLMEKNFAAYQMRDAAEKRMINLFSVTALEDYFDRDALRQEMAGYAGSFITAQHRIDQDRLSLGERAAFERLLKAVQKTQPSSDRAMDLAVEEQWSEGVQALVRKSLNNFAEVNTALNIFVAEVEAETNAQQLVLKKMRAHEIKLITALGLFLIVLSMLIGAIVVRREIAHTKTLEQRVEERTAQLGERDIHYRTIIETAADGIISTDKKGRIESFNPASERIFGFSADEILGQGVERLMPAFHAHHHRKYMGDYMRGGKPGIIGIGRELVGSRKDGSEFPIWLAISRMQMGDEVKFVGIVSDITAQKTAEHEIRQLAKDTALVASILRLSLTSDDLDHILQVALDSILERRELGLHSKGSIFLTNEKLGHLQMRAQSNLGSDLANACKQIDIGYCLCGKVAQSKMEIEKSHIDEDHVLPPLHADEHGHFCVPINYANDNLGVVNLYTPHGHTITEHERRLVWSVADTLAGGIHRHYKEDELRREKERAELANRTKTAFLANMSHELRTPLNAIIGYSEMMELETLGPIGSDRYKEYLGHISGSGHHLFGLINDLLDVSRIETNEFPLREETFEAEAVIREALSLIQSRFGGTGNEISFAGAGPLPMLTADKRRLKQVLVNLLRNAVKFTDGGGHIEVRTEGEIGSDFRILVIDNGIGIAESDIETVFEMFGQVDGSLTRKYDGAGLGLPLSQKLMKKHGGSLQIESQVGHGTTAILILPPERVDWS